MPLRFADGSAFAIGASPCWLSPVTNQERTPRLHINISINRFRTVAFIDTGGVFLLCPPESAQEIGVSPAESVEETDLVFRGIKLIGQLYRLPVTFPAEVGRSLSQELNVFVPNPLSYQPWQPDFPCVLGLQGCLERIRFAVDPEHEMFYFGGFGEA